MNALSASIVRLKSTFHLVFLFFSCTKSLLAGGPRTDNPVFKTEGKGSGKILK